MIGYFDTSAFVPLLIAEPASGLCRRLWDDADAVVTARLTYVEAAAALAQALRLARLTKQSYRAAMRILDRLWDEFEVADVDDRIVRRATQLSNDGNGGGIPRWCVVFGAVRGNDYPREASRVKFIIVRPVSRELQEADLHGVLADQEAMRH